MLEGFYLYINQQYEGFIHSNIIPRINEVIDYNNMVCTVVTVKYKISKDKDNEDATDIKIINYCDIHAIF